MGLWSSKSDPPPFGRGIFEGLRARVKADVDELTDGNSVLKAARYSWPVRHFRRWISGSSLAGWLATYGLTVAVLLCLEALMSVHAPSWSILPTNLPENDLFRDIAGYFITAQVGLLAVLTVAVSVVTLLSERDEGVSVNTDVRLYYVQSYTGEVATSGVALLIVLVVQLFWPFLNIVHGSFGGIDEQATERALTAVHGIWLVLNLVLFLRFIRTTLDFVVAGNRAQMRKRYVATAIVPTDVSARLFSTYYPGLADFILGKTAVEDGPYITFGMGPIDPEHASVLVRRELARPSVLSDVRLGPLGWVIRRWYKRTLAMGSDAPGRARTIQLAFPTATTATLSGPVELAVQNGGADLTWLERRLVGWSFRFRKAGQADRAQPTPGEFIEQLLSNVVRAIVARAANAFDDALNETTDFHKFLLEAQNTRDEKGDKVNLADFTDGLFNRPTQKWTWEYRRVHVAAVNELPSSTYFVDGMGRVPLALWPRAPRDFPDSVLDQIQDLGRHQVVAFEDWVTKKALLASGEAESGRLAGSDLRGYERALISFVATWEGFGTIIANSFGLTEAARDGAQYWDAVGALWPSLWAHLRNAAYFLASAVWNDDLVGAERFRDLLVRWLHGFYRELDNDFPIRDGLVLSPDILKAPLADAQAAMRHIVLFPRVEIAPRPIFGVVLREMHYDMLVITSAIFAYWHSTKRQPSAVSSNAATKLIAREPLRSEGTDLAAGRGAEPKSVFRAILDLLIRQAIYPRFQESGYGGHLEGVIQMLNSLSAPRMVPGRIYSGVGLDHFDTLKPELLAMMAANLPGRGDDGASDMFARLLASPMFAEDETLRDFEHVLSHCVSMLDGDGDERFEATMRLFHDAPDVAGCRSRLKAILEAMLVGLKTERTTRVGGALLDTGRFDQVIDTVSNALLAGTQPIGAFAPSIVQRVDGEIDQREFTFRTLDRGLFTTPPMSPINFAEIPRLVSDIVREFVQDMVVRELDRQQKDDVVITTGASVRDFFTRALSVAQAAGLGFDSVFLVPSEPFGMAVAMSSEGFVEAGLEDFTFVRDTALTDDLGYCGSIDGFPVFHGHPDLALCAPRAFLTQIEFAGVRGTDRIFDFELFDEGNPQESSVRFWVAPRFTWAKGRMLRFRFGASEAERPETGQS